MNKESLREYLRQSGFLPFEVETLILLITNINSEPIMRLIEDRKSLYLTKKKWNAADYKLAIQKVYYDKEAYIVDAEGKKHADPTKLLQHYQTFTKQEDELLTKVKQSKIQQA